MTPALLIATLTGLLIAGMLLAWRYRPTPAPPSILQLMAAVGPHRSKVALAQDINSPQFLTLPFPDQLMLAQEMVQTFINPNMSIEETNHVKEIFTVALLGLKAGGTPSYTINGRNIKTGTNN